MEEHESDNELPIGAETPIPRPRKDIAEKSTLKRDFTHVMVKRPSYAGFEASFHGPFPVHGFGFRQVIIEKDGELIPVDASRCKPANAPNNTERAQTADRGATARQQGQALAESKDAEDTADCGATARQHANKAKNGAIEHPDQRKKFYGPPSGPPFIHPGQASTTTPPAHYHLRTERRPPERFEARK